MELEASGTTERLGNANKNDIAVIPVSKDFGGPPHLNIPVAESQDHPEETLVQRCVVIQRDEKGYGFTVSGDNPVFVQSVKLDGAACKAGVQQGDRIVKVNRTLVTQFNHLDVVKLIKSCSYVALTLLGKPPGSQPKSPVPGGSVQLSASPTPVSSSHIGSSQHPLNMNPLAAANNKVNSPSERVTAPQPVDAEKQQELTNRRIHTIRMMLEQELAYLEKLRSEHAKNQSDKVRVELNGATKRVKTLQEQLFNLTGVQHDHNNMAVPTPRSPSLMRSNTTVDSYHHHPVVQLHHSDGGQDVISNSRGNILKHQISAPTPLRNSADIPNSDSLMPLETNIKSNGNGAGSVDVDQLSPLSKSPEVKNYRERSTHRHHRHISSPEGLTQFSEQLLAASRDGIARTKSELVNRRDRAPEQEFEPPKLPERPTRLPSSIKDESVTPPGTPPPPYVSSNTASPLTGVESSDNCDVIDAEIIDDVIMINSPCFIPEEPPPPPPRMSPCAIAANFEGRPLPPIPSQQMNSSNSTVQSDCVPPALPPRPLPGQLCNIMSMEDDDFHSDSEVNQLDDHGPFGSLWKLLRNPAHLAVFLYYLLSSRNRNPSSLFFYIISETYKEGKQNEMKKWAYEIHSSFLVPDAPLRVEPVDETVLHEIDDSLQNNLEKEDDLRNIFTKARKKAGEELNELLADFRNTRTLGLGGFYGPVDQVLQEAIHDKSKEMRIVEQNLMPMLQAMCEEYDNSDERCQALASALATVMKQLGVKSQNAFNVIDRIPTFVAKDKSRIRFLNRHKKVIFIKEHHFIPQHYYVVTYCNHCQLIIWGIGNQGYQCQDCEMNIHKNCVKVIDEVCLGPIRQKKDKKKEDRRKDRMSGLMENIIGKNRKPSSSGPLNDKPRRSTDDHDSHIDPLNECTATGDKGTGTSHNNASAAQRLLKGSVDASELQNNTSRKGSSGPIGRSESFRQRREQRPSFRKRSDPNIPRSKSDVDVDDKVVNLTSSQSSSNSSLSTSLDSPSNSLEAVHRNATGGPMTAAAKADEITTSLPIGGSTTTQNSISSPQNIHVQHHVYDDSDLEAEAEAPNWQEGIEWDVVRTMKPKEKNRQDVINEFFHTEKTHVRNLKVLESVFYRPMLQEQIASTELIKLLFGNLEEMIEIHGAINSAMKETRQQNSIVGDIGDLLLSLFDGTAGDNLKRAAASFCQNQSIALDMLKHRQRKDQKLAQFIAEAELNHLCRRLQLKDIIPTGMQRLTKYPLLLENIAKYTTGTDEHKKVLRAVDCSKSILNHVNQSVKEAENRQRMIDLQKKMDRSHFDKVDHPIAHEFKNFDLAKYKLIHDGSLTWRLNKQKSIDIHLLVVEQFLVLLQKQDDKYILKFHNTNIISGRDETKMLLSPIIKLENALFRTIATEKKGFFIVALSRANQQGMYELVARTVSETKTWLNHLQNVSESCKSKSRKSNPVPALSERTESSEEPAEVEPEKAKEPTEQSAFASSSSSTSDIADNPEPIEVSENSTSSTPPSGPADASKLSNATTEEKPQPPQAPSQLPTVEERSKSSVGNGASSAEKLRRKDEQIVAALKEKQLIVADILNVPHDDFENIADVVTEVEGEKEPRELVLAAIVQVNKLASIINETLRVTEEDSICASAVTAEEYAAMGGGATAATAASALSHPTHSPKSPRLASKVSRMPAAPTHKLLGVSRVLNQQLTQLLHVIVERDEEREQFRKELRSSREQIHILHEATRRRRPDSSSQASSRPNSLNSAESSSLSGDNCLDTNVLSDHCSCDIPQSDDESGANISPIQGVVPVVGLAECVQADPKDVASAITASDEPQLMNSPPNHVIQDTIDANKEMYVDAPSDLPPVTITDLDSDHEIELNVDDPNCDEGMIVDAIDDTEASNSQMSTDEQNDKSSDNNNIETGQPNPVIGAIFF